MSLMLCFNTPQPGVVIRNTQCTIETTVVNHVGDPTSVIPPSSIDERIAYVEEFAFTHYGDDIFGVVVTSNDNVETTRQLLKRNNIEFFEL